MKKVFFMMIPLLLMGCANQELVDLDMAGDLTKNAPASEIDVLMEKARWGDGEACLKLADCYRDGIGVKPDFVSMMNMVSLAEDFGAIDRMDNYFGDIPRDNELEYISKWAKDEADRDALMGALAIEKGDTLLGRQMIQAIAEQQNPLAMLLSCGSTYSDVHEDRIARLIEVAEKVPYAYRVLGNVYSGSRCKGLEDGPLAAYYYLKADEHTCLGKEGARWLLDYYYDGGDLPISKTDIERLKILSQSVVDEVIEIVDEDYVEEVKE